VKAFVSFTIFQGASNSRMSRGAKFSSCPPPDWNPDMWVEIARISGYWYVGIQLHWIVLDQKYSVR